MLYSLQQICSFFFNDSKYIPCWEYRITTCIKLHGGIPLHYNEFLGTEPTVPSPALQPAVPLEMSESQDLIVWLKQSHTCWWWLVSNYIPPPFFKSSRQKSLLFLIRFHYSPLSSLGQWWQWQYTYSTTYSLFLYESNLKQEMAVSLMQLSTRPSLMSVLLLWNNPFQFPTWNTCPGYKRYGKYESYVVCVGTTTSSIAGWLLFEIFPLGMCYSFIFSAVKMKNGFGSFSELSFSSFSEYDSKRTIICNFKNNFELSGGNFLRSARLNDKKYTLH